MENPSSEHSGSASGVVFGRRRRSGERPTTRAQPCAPRSALAEHRSSVRRHVHTVSNAIIACRDDVETVRRPSRDARRPARERSRRRSERLASAGESSIERFRPSNARKSSSQAPRGVSRPNPAKNPRQNRNKSRFGFWRNGTPKTTQNHSFWHGGVAKSRKSPSSDKILRSGTRGRQENFSARRKFFIARRRAMTSATSRRTTH